MAEQASRTFCDGEPEANSAMTSIAVCGIELDELFEDIRQTILWNAEPRVPYLERQKRPHADDIPPARRLARNGESHCRQS